MAQEVLCRRCGVVIGYEGSGHRYTDPYLPAFSQLCKRCSDRVSEEFDRRFAEVARRMRHEGFSRREIESTEHATRQRATSRTNYDRGEMLPGTCSWCGAVGSVSQGGRCAKHEREAERAWKKSKEEYERNRRRS